MCGRSRLHIHPRQAAAARRPRLARLATSVRSDPGRADQALQQAFQKAAPSRSRRNRPRQGAIPGGGARHKPQGAAMRNIEETPCCVLHQGGRPGPGVWRRRIDIRAESGVQIRKFGPAPPAGRRGRLCIRRRRRAEQDVGRRRANQAEIAQGPIGERGRGRHTPTRYDAEQEKGGDPCRVSPRRPASPGSTAARGDAMSPETPHRQRGRPAVRRTGLLQHRAWRLTCLAVLLVSVAAE